MRKTLSFLLLLALVVLSIGSPALRVNAQDGEVPWQVWADKDIATLTDDNSGSTFALSEDVPTPVGAPSLQVTPGGSAEETKVAFPVTGADLQDWTTHSQVELEVYLPEGNTLNPNKFFMGMADVTGEFAWVDGVFSETAAQPGWNRIVFKPTDPMRAPKADANYNLYLSFFNADDAGTKTPLTEPIYLGDIYLSGAAAAATEEAPQAAATEAPAAAEAAGELLWPAWENKDISALGDDNTGSTFAASSDVQTPAGTPALQVTPSGTAPETKLAFQVSGADLQDLANYSQVELEVYLPEGNTLNPDRFFLGMADTTGDFAWVDGVFSDTEAQPGWNRIVFKPSDPMRAPKADANYTLYFSFFEGANKTPLTEPFDLGSLYLTGPEAPAAAAPAENKPVLWKAWEFKNPGMFGDDNTGTNFAQSSDVLTPESAPSLQIIPGGALEETKLAFPVSGTNLQDWTTHDQVELEVYLPPENSLNPNSVFLGLGDLTTEWAWIGGVWGTFQGDSGWTRVVFVLDPIMQKLEVGGTYSLYLAFMNLDENQNKTPLTEPFYLGSVYLTMAPQAEESGGTATLTEDAVYQREVDLLLSFDDVALVDAVAQETFDYFWYEANPANGLIKDRSTPDSPASIAAVGFGLAAIPVAVDRGWITHDQGYDRVLTTLQTFANGGVQGDHGFFFHFVDMQTGERAWSSELSSIDSALFIAGALTAGQYFKGTEVETLANQLYEAMDWQWMMSNGDMVAMGWKPDIGFISSFWDHFDESQLLYVLAIGSPTHPVPPEAWAEWKRPVNVAQGYIYLTGDPLFVYQYPLVWLDLKDKEDAYANYFNNTVKACQRNQAFSASQAENFSTYQNGVWGISASDGPSGYRAYGTGSQDGTVAPYASVACLPFTPDLALSGIRALLTQFGSKVWREYGFVSAINSDVDWYSTAHIGIDEGDIVLMIANYQDGFVWDLFMANEPVQNALKLMGFTEKASDYAVTPAYLEQAQAES